DLSEDLAQEAFLRAWQKRDQLKDTVRFRPWLCSIARNLVRNDHRQKKIDAVSIDQVDPVDVTANPSSQAVSREGVMILEQALKHIPNDYREPLVLFYRQEQSIKEVSDQLDLNEATVRTRLHRGRQMLKQQTAAIVERTLEKTAPDAAFTKTVMAAVGAGIAATVAGGATATAATVAATTAGSAATTTVLSAVGGLLATTGAKILAVAATVVIAASVAVYSYSSMTDRQPMDSELSVVEQTAGGNPPAGGNMESREQQAQGDMTAQSAMVVQQLPAGVLEGQPEESVEITEEVVLTSSRHPDWPTIDETVENFYCRRSIRDEYEEIWVHMPRRFRRETKNDILIDNGKDRIEAKKADKTVQYSATLNAGDKPVGRRHSQALKDLESVRYAYFFGRPVDSILELQYDINQIAQEDDGLLLVYQITGDNLETYDIKAYVDMATRLPEKIVVINNDPNSAIKGQPEEMLFDFAPIDDSVFEYTPGADETVLPFKQKPCFRGQVVDAMGQAVAGADVFIHYFPLHGKDYITGRSDTNGRFQINLPEKPGDKTVFLPVYYWATIPDDPNYAAWTILHVENDLAFQDANDLIQGHGGTIIQTDSKPDTVSKIVNGETVTSQRMSNIQKDPVISDIRLVMEPMGTLTGYITDKAGNPIKNAKLNAAFRAVTVEGRPMSFSSDQSKWKFSTVSDSTGYYKFQGLPPFWKGCVYTINIAAAGFVSESKRIKLAQPLDYKEFNIALNPQLVTIKGVVKDNYGQPLAGRGVSLSVPKVNVRNCSTKTDPNGVFVLEGCPDVPGLKVRLSLSHDYPENSLQASKEVRDAFLYYPDISQNVPYKAGQQEYFLELTAIRPEMIVEVFVTDSAGKPLPELKVKLGAEQLRNGDLVSYPWRQMKLEQRTDSKGCIVFDNVPEMLEMNIQVSPDLSFIRELHALNGKMKERQRLHKVDQAYRDKYQEMKMPIELIQGQTEYSVHVVMLTKTEFQALPEASP
ncbi:MAG: sigma-70 family RNA polymerase sigma factor, partial [Planctomycetota bacterium]